MTGRSRVATTTASSHRASLRPFVLGLILYAVSAAFAFLPGVNSTLASHGRNMTPSSGGYAASPSGASGELERLKQEEARLASMLASIRRQKLSVLRSRRLTIGIIGFGRFGQFMAEKFTRYGDVVGTSRSDYTRVASEMGARYIPLSDLESFVMMDDLDVIVVAVSIVSFEDTMRDLVPHLRRRIEEKGPTSCPLIVDVLSVKEHAREVMLGHLPEECDVLCTHPMFGPDSARHGWQGQTFVYEMTRVDGVVLDPSNQPLHHRSDSVHEFLDERGVAHDVHENSDAHIEGIDRMERFLSIWEEEGCNMVSMSCKEHDSFTASSQFITHLMGRILGAQGLRATPIDTKGFQSVLKLIETTNADSFDLFFGLYKYNRNSVEIIHKLKDAMDDVVGKLFEKEGKDGGGDANSKKSCL